MFNIPPIKNSAAKSQHFVPKTYMKQWCMNEKSVNTYSKKSCCYKIRNIESINCINYFYDFLPGGLMPDEALNSIYGFMQGSTVKYTDKDGKNQVAVSLQDINTAYNYRKSWEVTDPDGYALSKKDKNKLLTHLQQCRYSFSEEEWSKQYESQWETFINDVENRLRDLKSHSGSVDPLNRCDFELLFKYLIIYNWRCEIGNSDLNNTVDEILSLLDLKSSLIPPEDRIHYDDTSVAEEVKHGFMRMSVYKFLHGDENVMDKYRRMYQDNLTFVFWLTNQDNKFITSDQPSMLIDGHDGKLEHILIATPTLLISTMKKDKDNYLILDANDCDTVKFYNEKIFNKAEIVILPDGIGNVEDFTNVM